MAVQESPTSDFPTFVNACYYPNWAIYKGRKPSELPLRSISHVFYAFAWPTETGDIQLSDDWADQGIDVDGVRGCLNALVDLKKSNPNLKIILSIGGGGKGSEAFVSASRDAPTRDFFANNARQLVDRHGLDGIDIDWEHPSDRQQGYNYNALLAALRDHLPQPYTLTTALPAGEWALQHINLEYTSQCVDFINLMSYDFAGPWTDRSGHHAQLFAPRRPANDAARLCGASAVDYLRQTGGVAPHKIVLGVPAYGRSFLGATNAGQPYQGSAGDEGTFEYADLPREGAREMVDAEVGAAYCVGNDGGFVSYDNIETLRMKAGFVRRQGLAGLFYWTGTGDARGPRSLVVNGFEALHGM